MAQQSAFERKLEKAFDLVIEHNANPRAAARAVGIEPEVMNREWDARIEATHGGPPQ